MHDQPPDETPGHPAGGTDRPRTLLVRALNDGLTECGLSLDRVVARLRARLDASTVRGLSTSSISRYLDPDRSELPDPAVLAELARVFRTDPAELDRWQHWHRQAKQAADHELRDRRAARRAATTPTATATPVPVPARPEPTGEPSVTGRAARWRRPHRWGAALGVLALAAVLGAAVWARGSDDATADTASVVAPSGSAAGREPTATPADLAEGLAHEVEVGALGGDSRCSAPKPGPSGTRLRACAMVQPRQVLFAVRIDNPTNAPVEVTAKVAGSWSGIQHSCDPGRSVVHTTIAPGATFTSDPEECVTPRRSAPLAYQAEVFAAAGDDRQWTGHLFSPRANVYPDRETLWRCVGDVPC
ncbi:hypothetical protein ACFY4B_29935 [Kitasatospora sp. NPDC001261]|uniref:hypothetical protein n=1 Tax=Kitasatospora sp. NPDC001261 TaxID=3364012 RepID=UPI0036BA94CF